jgi:hypothetical protein
MLNTVQSQITNRTIYKRCIKYYTVQVHLHVVAKLMAVYKSKTRTGNPNPSVNKRVDCGICASASVRMFAMRRSVRLRTSNFSCSILACVIDSGGGIVFFAISGILSESRLGGNSVSGKVDKRYRLLKHASGSYLEYKILGCLRTHCCDSIGLLYLRNYVPLWDYMVNISKTPIRHNKCWRRNTRGLPTTPT